MGAEGKPAYADCRYRPGRAGGRRAGHRAGGRLLISTPNHPGRAGGRSGGRVPPAGDGRPQRRLRPHRPRRLGRHGLSRPGRDGALLRREQPGARLPGQAALFRRPGAGGGADGPAGAHLLLNGSEAASFRSTAARPFLFTQYKNTHVSIEIGCKKRRVGEFPRPPLACVPVFSSAGWLPLRPPAAYS